MFKKTINFVYEDKLDHEKFNKIIEPVKDKYNIEIYNELNSKEKRKAIMIKSKFGARLNPFIGITNEGKMLHGFYRESCDSLYHFERYLSNSKKGLKLDVDGGVFGYQDFINAYDDTLEALDGEDDEDELSILLTDELKKLL